MSEFITESKMKMSGEGPRAHTRESFTEAMAELKAFIVAFEQKHGIGVLAGFATPQVETPSLVWQGSLVYLDPGLWGAAMNMIATNIQRIQIEAAVKQALQGKEGESQVGPAPGETVH